MLSRLRGFLISGALLLSFVAFAISQSGQPVRPLTIAGHSGQATVIQQQGRAYVDLLQLVDVAKGSLAFKGNTILLTLSSPSSETSASAPEVAQTEVADSQLSHTFMRAGIEQFASMREWASTLANALENGYPIDHHSIDTYREQAAHNLRLATASASSTADKSALGLLTNEFGALEEWSDTVLQEHKSMDTAKYSMSENAVRETPSSRKILSCGHFLATMLGSGTFQDDPSCH
jgi:hypothetical protein